MAQAVLAIALALLAALPPAAHANKNNPAWTELRPEQQRILAPIQGEWESLDGTRKRKWLGVAQRYPKMSADEQERLQQRMKEWIGLTSEQRRAARGKYREFEQLGPDEVRQKWDQYTQELAAKEAAAKPAEDEGAAKALESTAAEGDAASTARPQ
jgi:hypothetical protein